MVFAKPLKLAQAAELIAAPETSNVLELLLSFLDETTLDPLLEQPLMTLHLVASPLHLISGSVL
jgi:hypothetical protein